MQIKQLNKSFNVAVVILHGVTWEGLKKKSDFLQYLQTFQQSGKASMCSYTFILLL